MSMVAAIRKRVVEEDNHLSDEVFAEGLALATILPGPVAVNVAAWSGYLLAGLVGALIAVTAVLLPSFLIMVFLFFSLQWASQLMNLGLITFLVSGVAFGLILSAGIQSTKKTLQSSSRIFVFSISLVVLFFFPGYWVILMLIACWSALGQLIKTDSPQPESVKFSITGHKATNLLLAALILGGIVSTGHWFFLSDVFSQFTRISLTLFGGGYVVVPILDSVLVEELRWISRDDLLMGISLGQLTPGPLLISAVYFGQKISGITGAFAALAGMFFPAALLMIICGHFMSGIRSSKAYNKAVYLILPFVASLIVFASLSILRSAWPAQKDPLLFVWWGLCFASIHFFKVRPVFLIGLAIGAALLTLAF